MKKGKFLLGMALGTAAGVGLEMAMHAKQGRMKTTVGRTMQAMGTAMDNAADTLDHLAANVKK